MSNYSLIFLLTVSSLHYLNIKYIFLEKWRFPERVLPLRSVCHGRHGAGVARAASQGNETCQETTGGLLITVQAWVEWFIIIFVL